MILSGAIQDESTPNGRRWTPCKVSLSEEEKNEKIFYDICKDRKGKLWAAGEDGIYLKKSNSWSKVTSAPTDKFVLIKIGNIGGIAATEKGNIYVCNSAVVDGLNSSWKFGTSDAGGAIQIANYGTTYAIISKYGGFDYSLDGISWTQPQAINSYNANSCYLSDNAFFVGSSGGIFYYDRANDEFKQSNVSDEAVVDSEPTGYAITTNGKQYSIFLTTDGGKTWKNGVNSTYVSPLVSSTYLIQNGIIYTPENNSFFRFSNSQFNQIQNVPVLKEGEFYFVKNNYIINKSTGQAGYIDTNSYEYVKVKNPYNSKIYSVVSYSQDKFYYATDKGIILGNTTEIFLKENLLSSDFTYAGNKWFTFDYYSLDGKNWGKKPNTFYISIKDLYYLGGVYFYNVLSGGDNAYYSLDGINWKTMLNFRYIAYDGSGTWVLNTSDRYYWSKDGITWTKESTNFVNTLLHAGNLAYGGGMWIGENRYDYAYYSINGIEWKQTNLKLGDKSKYTALTNQYYYSENLGIWLTWRSVGTNDMWGYSTDGITWTTKSTSDYIVSSSIVEGNSIIIFTLNSGAIKYLLWNSGSIFVGQLSATNKEFYYNDGFWISLAIENNTNLVIETYIDLRNDSIRKFSITHDKTISLSDFVVEYFKGTWFIQDKVNLKNYYSKDSSTWKETDKGPNFKLSKAINNNGIIVARGTDNQMYYSESLI